jgi:hypothetical protein
MGGLSEKIRLVRGDHVDKVDQFLFHPARTEEVIAIAGERREAQPPQPLLETGLNHRSLAFGNFDPALTVDEVREA